MSGELREVRVEDLYKECSYPLVPKALAQSQCCRGTAFTAVELPDGARAYRCSEHEGLIEGSKTGTVHQTVFTRREVPDDVVVNWPER